VTQLPASRDYNGLEVLTRGLRLSVAAIEQAVAEYGRTIVVPPKDAFDLLEASEILTAAPNTWSVTIPLWTLEEGRSDLTAEVTFAIRGGASAIELDNIHVL